MAKRITAEELTKLRKTFRFVLGAEEVFAAYEALQQELERLEQRTQSQALQLEAMLSEDTSGGQIITDQGQELERLRAENERLQEKMNDQRLERLEEYDT
jgi:hypothetical protein